METGPAHALQVFDGVYARLRNERMQRQLRDWKLHREILTRVDKSAKIDIRKEARKISDMFGCPERVDDIEVTLARAAELNRVPVKLPRT